MKRAGEYMIYKLTDGETTINEFFLPDSLDLDRYIDRKTKLYNLQREGFRVLAIAYVDREHYLNAKLDEHVKDYCEVDKYEQEIRSKFRAKQMDTDIFFDTIRCCQDIKWTKLKQIDMLVRRCARSDYDVYNEIGLMLVNQYRQAMI